MFCVGFVWVLGWVGYYVCVILWFIVFRGCLLAVYTWCSLRFVLFLTCWWWLIVFVRASVWLVTLCFLGVGGLLLFCCVWCSI